MSPRVVIGTEVYSGNWGIQFSSSDIRRIADLALRYGVNEIDTAASYGEAHFVEGLLGDAIAGLRERVILGSKFCHNSTGANKGLPVRTVSDIECELAGTLKALKTGYLDIYYFHSGSDEVYFQDHIWAWLNDMVRQGVIRRLGLSLNHALVKSDSKGQLLAAKQYGISVIQTVLNMYSRDALRFVIPFCKSEGLTVYGRMPLAKGLLSGKYTKASNFAQSDPRARNGTTTDEILDFVEKHSDNITVEAAIRWALQHVDKVVVGAKTGAQLEQVIGCATS